jgi:hypothetical protein
MVMFYSSKKDMMICHTLGVQDLLLQLKRSSL